MTTKPNPVHACPKWQSCNAPVCPLDPNHAACQTQNGDAVCPWLREAMKADGASRIPAEIAPTIERALPELLTNGGAALRAKLKRAGDSAPRMPPESPKRYAAREVLSLPHTNPAPIPSFPVGHTL